MFILPGVYVTPRQVDSKRPQIGGNSKVGLWAICNFNFSSLLLSSDSVLCWVLELFHSCEHKSKHWKKEKMGKKTTLELICCSACLFCLSVTFDASVLFMFSSCVVASSGVYIWVIILIIFDKSNALKNKWKQCWHHSSIWWIPSGSFLALRETSSFTTCWLYFYFVIPQSNETALEWWFTPKIQAKLLSTSPVLTLSNFYPKSSPPFSFESGSNRLPVILTCVFFEINETFYWTKVKKKI